MKGTAKTPVVELSRLNKLGGTLCQTKFFNYWKVQRAPLFFYNWNLAWFKTDLGDFLGIFFLLKVPELFACAFQLSSNTFPFFLPWLVCTHCFWEKQRQNIEACTKNATKWNKSIYLFNFSFEVLCIIVSGTRRHSAPPSLQFFLLFVLKNSGTFEGEKSSPMKVT